MSEHTQWTAEQQAVKDKESRRRTKLWVKLGEFVCWLIGIYGLSTNFGVGMVALGIQWLKVDDLCISLLGFAGLAGLALIDRFIDKLFESPKKSP